MGKQDQRKQASLNELNRQIEETRSRLLDLKAEFNRKKKDLDELKTYKKELLK